MGKAEWVRDDSVEARRRRIARLLAIGAVRAALRPREGAEGTATEGVDVKAANIGLVSDTI